MPTQYTGNGQDLLAGAFLFGISYEACGKSTEAIAPLQQALAASQRNPMVIGALGHASAGRKQEAEQLLQKPRAISGREYTSPLSLALIVLGLGDYEMAFVELERALTARAGWLVFLRVDPRFDCARSDPRFENLLQRVGLISSAASGVALAARRLQK